MDPVHSCDDGIASSNPNNLHLKLDKYTNKPAEKLKSIFQSNENDLNFLTDVSQKLSNNHANHLTPNLEFCCNVPPEASTEQFEPSPIRSQTTVAEVDSSLFCGVGRWRPKCLRRAGNIRAFLAAACFISCLQAAFSGYTSSQATTLEKRFAIGSSIIGVINSFFEIGYICSVVYVSYVGSHGRVPLWLSIGLFSMSAGAFLWSVPHFLFFSDRRSESSIMKESVCIPSNTTCSGDSCSSISSVDCSNSLSSSFAFLPIFLAAQLLIGSGSSPILTLTPPFIDDHVPSSRAAPMIASQYAAAAMGPVFGFALGAVLLQYPADILSHSRVHINPEDPGWVGAWWGGFILLGILVLLGAIILLMFPRKLQELSTSSHNKATVIKAESFPIENGSLNNEAVPMKFETHNNSTLNNQLSSEDNSEYRNPWSDFSCSRHHKRKFQYSCSPRLRCRSPDLSSSTWKKFTNVFYSLVRNRIYLVVCLCISSEMFMVIGFASFLPKYLEMEYHINKSTASAIAGGLIVPCGAFGILVGGLILNRFRFRRQGAIRFVLAMNVIILLCICCFFALGCRNPDLAGITQHYPSSSSNSLTSRPHLITPEMLISKCNSNCNCDPNYWSPVCHISSGTTFISPCFAGCTNYTSPSNSDLIDYTNCNCVKYLEINEPNPKGIVVAGECELKCTNLVPFIFTLTLLLFLTGVIQNPLLMVTMRSVNHDERSFALGLQFVIIRFVANLPSPIVFGRVIDGACRFWRSECGRRGDCTFVDVYYLNWYLTGLGIVLKGSGLIIYIALLWLLRRSKSNQLNGDLTNDPKPIECQGSSSQSFHSAENCSNANVDPSNNNNNNNSNYGDKTEGHTTE